MENVLGIGDFLVSVSIVILIFISRIEGIFRGYVMGVDVPVYVPLKYLNIGVEEELRIPVAMIFLFSFDWT